MHEWLLPGVGEVVQRVGGRNTVDGIEMCEVSSLRSHEGSVRFRFQRVQKHSFWLGAFEKLVGLRQICSWDC